MKLSAWPEHRTLNHRLSPAGCSKMQLNSPGLRTVDSMPCKSLTHWFSQSCNVARLKFLHRPKPRFFFTLISPKKSYRSYRSYRSYGCYQYATSPSIWRAQIHHQIQASCRWLFKPLGAQSFIRAVAVAARSWCTPNGWNKFQLLDDGWRMGQLGSTGVNWGQSSETAVEVSRFSGSFTETLGTVRTLALQGIAVLAVLRALHRNGIRGNPAQSWGTQYDSVTMRTPKWAETAPLRLAPVDAMIQLITTPGSIHRPWTSLLSHYWSNMRGAFQFSHVPSLVLNFPRLCFFMKCPSQMGMGQN